MRADEYDIMYQVEDRHWWFISRREFLSRMFRALGLNIGDNRRIADIGAGTGGMYTFLSQYGAVIGVEPHPRARQYAKRRRMKVIEATAEHSLLRAKSMDMVCILDVLYHQGVHDQKALQEAYRILRPGGWLVITDCALPFLFGPNDRAASGRERYVLSQLVSKVVSSGFIVQKRTYTFFALFPIFALKRLTDRLLPKSTKQHSDVGETAKITNALCKGMYRLEALLLPFVSYPWGSSLLILAQKN